MKVLQTADNHLGEMAFSRIDPITGLNARGQDFLDSLKNIVNIALKEKVDVFLVVGDFFTRVNPNTRFIYDAMKEVKKLSKANIISIFVSGNHETPKIDTTINPLKLFEQIDNVHVVLDPTTINIDGVDFVCVPAPPFFDNIKIDFDPMLQAALRDSNSEQKILAAHLPLGQATAGSEHALESFMGECLDIKQIPCKFAYAALGHMHKFQKFEHKGMPVVYSGSSEKCDWCEEKGDKYTVLMEYNEKIDIKPVKLPIRNMITIVDQDCWKLSAPKINRLILDIIEIKKRDIKDSLVRINLDRVGIDEYRLIDWSAIKQCLTDCGAFDWSFPCRTAFSQLISDGSNSPYMLSPSEELEFYVKNKPEYKGFARALLKLGKQIIDEAKEIQNEA